MPAFDITNTDWPRVSIILITKGHHEMAKSAVASILAADYPVEKREVIVVEETDAPDPIVGESVRYAAIPVKNLGFPFARNKGVNLASADIIAFTDDDCLVEREWLKALVRPFIECSGNSKLDNDNAAGTSASTMGVDLQGGSRLPGASSRGISRPVQPSEVAAVAGAVLVSGCGAIGECENILGFPGGGARYLNCAHGAIIRWTTFSTCNCAVRKSAIERAGGFCEKLKSGGEDRLLSKKIMECGGLILYNPNARIHHKTRDSFLGVLRWFIRRGRASVELVRIVNNKRVYVVPMVFNSVLLRLAVAISTCLMIGWFVLPVIGALMLLYYVSVLWRFRWARACFPSIKTFRLLPAVKVVMDLGMDIGVLSAVIIVRKSEVRIQEPE